jgi:hypothetical protein
VYNLKVYCDNLQKSIHIPMPEIVLFILIENFHQLHDMFYYIVEGTFLPCFKFAARNKFTNFSAALVHQ